MKIAYQLVATGGSSCFNNLKTITSRQIYTKPPSEQVIEKFKDICTKDDGKHIDWIDPKTVTVRVAEYELIDEG